METNRKTLQNQIQSIYKSLDKFFGVNGLYASRLTNELRQKLGEKETQYKALGKTMECSNVLQLMDADLSYQAALNEELKNNPQIIKEDLEFELNFYI